MPTDKRARQRAGREARREALARQQRRRRQRRSSIVVVVIAAVVIGSVYLITNHHSSTPASASTPQGKLDAIAVKAGCPAKPATRVNLLTYKTAPPLTISTTVTYNATVKTDVGSFVISLDPKAAPQTVNSFVFLAKQGYFKCVIFHRVIPGFVDQTGDPTGTGSGTPGYTIPDEYPPKSASSANQYPLGSVAMANRGPNTTGGQWFVVTGSAGESLSNTYSLFGTVTSGMSVVQKINKDGTAGGTPKLYHRILSVRVKEA